MGQGVTSTRMPVFSRLGPLRGFEQLIKESKMNELIENPLKFLPLNTKRVYVMAKTHGGCKIYIPVDSYRHENQIFARNNLRTFLKSQPLPVLEDQPEPEPPLQCA